MPATSISAPVLGELHLFESRDPFWVAMNNLFGAERAQDAVKDLVAGGMVWTDKSQPIFGIERYRHSGDVLAICTQGDFPDRQWDVSSIVGYFLPGRAENNPELRKARQLHRYGREAEACEVVTKLAQRTIEHWNQFGSLPLSAEPVSRKKPVMR